MKDNKRIKGILYIMAAAFFFSLMSVLVRLSGDLPTMQKAFFRNAIAAVYGFIILSRTPEKFQVRKGNGKELFLRAFFGTVGLVCNFWAIDHLVISDANVLNKMSPFFAIIMSTFILKEKASIPEWITVLVAFSGAALVVKPTAGLASLPALVGLLGGFGSGVAYTYVRKLGQKGERTPVTVLAFSLFSTAVCVPFILVDFKPMTPMQVLILLGAGTAAMGGQLCITAAYTCAPAKEISVFDYTQVVYASLWGLLLFHEAPDALSVIGYVIIISMAVVKWQVARSKS